MANATQTTEPQALKMRAPFPAAAFKYYTASSGKTYDAQTGAPVMVNAADVPDLERQGWREWFEPVRMIHPAGGCAWAPRVATTKDGYTHVYGGIPVDVPPAHVAELEAQGWQRVDAQEKTK